MLGGTHAEGAGQNKWQVRNNIEVVYVQVARWWCRPSDAYCIAMLYNTPLCTADRSFRYASRRLWNQLLIHSVSLASHVLTHFLIHLSAHLCHHHHSHYPSLLHSRLKTCIFNKSFPPQYFFYTGLPSWSPDWTGLSILLDLFLVRFFFNFSVCPLWWTKLATRQLFTAR